MADINNISPENEAEAAATEVEVNEATVPEVDKKLAKEERQAKAAEEKFQAYADYAETYRLKLMAEKARAERAAARAEAKKKAAEKAKAAEEKAKAEAEAAEKENALAKELAEINERAREQEAALEKIREAEAEAARAEALAREEAERAAREAEERAQKEKEEAERRAKEEAEKAKEAVSESDDLVISFGDAEVAPDGSISFDAIDYAPEAFPEITKEQEEALRLMNEHRAAYEAEMERMKSHHINAKMREAAKAEALASDAYKLYEEEGHRFLKEAMELDERRAEEERLYNLRRNEMEQAINDFKARRKEAESVNGAIDNLVRGAELTAAHIPHVSYAPAKTDSKSDELALANAKLEYERELSEALIEKERAIAEAKLEAERRAHLEEQLALIKSFGGGAATAETAVAAAEKPSNVHTVKPGEIDKARDEKLREALARTNVKRTTALSSENPVMAGMTLKKLPSYLVKSEKEVDDINREYAAKCSEVHTGDSNRTLAVVDKLGLQRAKIAKLSDDLLLCHTLGAPEKYTRRPAEALNAATAEYNKLVDEYAMLTGHKLTRADENSAVSILSGEGYMPLPVLKTRREIVNADSGVTVTDVSPDDLKNANLKVDTVVGGIRQTDTKPTAVAPAGEPEEKKVALYTVAVTEKELPKYLKRQAVREKNLRERQKALKRVSPARAEESLVLVVERLGAQRELIENLSKDLKLCARSAKQQGKVKKYSKELKSAINEYNSIAVEYRNLTGDALTPADPTIPERIISGKKYRAIPVINYRKESLDGTVIEGTKGSVTAGAAYGLLSPKEREKLEARGVIPAAGAMMLYGLSKSEAKEKMRAEKYDLEKESLSLVEQAKRDEQRAKELRELAKHSATKEEKRALRQEAAALMKKSEQARSLAKAKKADAAELKTLGKYEEYLERKKLRGELDGVAKDANKTEGPGFNANDIVIGSAVLDGMTKRERRERMNEERDALINEANLLSSKSGEDALRAKQLKSEAKHAKSFERNALRQEAEALEIKSREEAAIARAKREEAKALKSVEAYEKYLDTKAARQNAEKFAEAAGAAVLAQRDLPKSERKVAMKEEREALLEEAKQLKADAQLNALRAKEERKLAKSGKRDERDAHKEAAELLESKSESEAREAKEKIADAKSLTSLAAYERYLNKKAVVAAAKEERALAESVKAEARANEKRELDQFAKDSKKQETVVAAVGAAAVAAANKKLPKRERKEAMIKEREALLSEAEALKAGAAQKALAAKEEKKLAKRGKRSERLRHKAEAETLLDESRRDTAAAKEMRADAKSLKNLKAYDKYLDKKIESELPDESEAAAAVAAVGGAKLSKAERKAAMKEEREALMNEAAALEEEAAKAAALAKEEKKLAKSGKRADKQAHKAEAKRLDEKAEESRRLAKESKKNAKQIKNLNAYDKYLEMKATGEAEKKAARGAESIDTEKYENYLAAQAAVAALALNSKVAHEDTRKAKDKRAAMKEEREALKAESDRLLREAKEIEHMAKEERKAAKRSRRSDRAQHEEAAQSLESASRERYILSDRKARIAKELKNLRAFEKYNEEKSALEAAKLARAKREIDKRLESVSAEEPVSPAFLAKSEKLAEKAREATRIPFDKGAANRLASAQTLRDEGAVARRFDSEIAALENRAMLSELHFGERTRKFKKQYKNTMRDIKRLNVQKKDAMKLEAKDNKRYYSVITTDIEKGKLGKKSDRSKLIDLQIELDALLTERDNLNTELTALYNSSSMTKADSKNTDRRLAAAARGSAKSYKKQAKLANQIDSLHIPLNDKEKIFTPMNEITALDGEIAKLNHKLKNEKLSGSAKSRVKSQLRKKKKARKKLARKVDKFSGKAKSRAKKESKQKSKQLIAIGVILVIAVVAVCGYLYRAEIIEAIKNIIPGIGG